MHFCAGLVGGVSGIYLWFYYISGVGQTGCYGSLHRFELTGRIEIKNMIIWFAAIITLCAFSAVCHDR